MLAFVSEILQLPQWQIAILVFWFGAIVGSFLNVYIYRFHTGKSLGGNSHCLSCARSLTWYELIPLFSYLGLSGRCRTCGSRIPSRYFVVELTTAMLFVLAASNAVSWLELIGVLFVVSTLVVITVYDFYHFIIPDGLTLAVLGGAIYLLGVAYLSGYPIDRILLDVGAAMVGASFFLLLWLISKGQWLGFGDVKLALPLGLLVGAPYVFTFVVVSFWIGAAVSLLIVLWQILPLGGKPRLQSPHGRLTMKSAVPFAPFLVAGCLLVLFTKINVLTLFSFQ